jgi:regulator of protease activity HflC (stomatin/prohibitin superfamily)
MFKTLTVAMNERAVLLKDGLPVRALAPGRHRFWTQRVDALTWKLEALTFAALPAVLEVLPTDWYDVVRVGPTQRGFVTRDERPVLFLRPGVHRLWKLDGVKVTLLDVTEPVPELTDEAKAIVPAGELVDVTVRQHERGLKYVQGRFEALLPPGRYRFWNHPGANVAVTVVDQRIQQLTISGQELMTRDKVTLRLTLTVEYAPADVAATAHTVADLQGALYLAVQLATREFVAGVTLDALLEGRDALTRWLEAQVVPRAKAFGVDVTRVGVKDVILPGEMKALLNRVIEAEKEALANVILRREEAAATRNMAQAAKVIAENPVLMRLKELEALREVAGKIGPVELHLGQDTLTRLLPILDRET